MKFTIKLCLCCAALFSVCGCAAKEPAPLHTPTWDITAHTTAVSTTTITTQSAQATTIRAARKVAIDAGHQARGNNELEPVGPGATESKAKVSSGTQGVSTGVPEYRLTLDVSKKLRDILLSRGYEVFMIRESHDMNISNRERAQLADQAGADILVRVHANGSENPEDNGLMMVAPTPNSPFVPQLYRSSRRLADDILAEMLKITGARDKGVWETDTMSGINWSSIPVVLVEMGYMSNPAEDERMQQAAYQEKLAEGMANGIDRFFE